MSLFFSFNLRKGFPSTPFLPAKSTVPKAAIRKTAAAGTDIRFGVNFEQSLPELLKDLKLVTHVTQSDNF